MKLTVQLRSRENRSYPVIVEPGVISKIPHIFHAAKWGKHVAIITDSKIGRLFIKDLLKGFKKLKIKVDVFTVPAGEKSKSLEQVAKVITKMVEAGLKRDCIVLGVGGGVVLDLAGFIASSYMRGVPFASVPTSLLSMVDAAIGGKTGVDLPIGKNLVGSFHQPKGVYIDPQLLKSLPDREFANGMAEVIKHAVIGDRGLFRMLENKKKRAKILKRDGKLLNKLILRNCRVKIKIVEKDEREGKLRILLNYGHSIGHAIEKAMNYEVPHGEAVGIGMVLENKFFKKKKMMKEKLYNRIKAVIEAYGLPTELPKKLPGAKVAKAIKSDKKVLDGHLKMILPVRIGKAKIYVQKKYSKIV